MAARGTSTVSSARLAAYDLRKLYIEALEPSFDMFQSAVGPYLVEEGRLVQHQWYGDKYVDLHVLALYRDAWCERALPVFNRLGSSIGVDGRHEVPRPE